MRRMACVDLPQLPLQLLLRRRPGWREGPVAVVEQDRPQGRVLWVDERARTRGVLPGMPYAAALSLAPGLRADVVPPAEIASAVAGLAARLRRFTPCVEPAREEPGVFWLDARGLERLWPSLEAWASAAASDLESAGFVATVVVGFGRFGTYALARSRRGVHVLGSEAEERAAARAVPLERISIEPAHLETLARLGVKTVGEFLDLPREGVGLRFGAGLERLHGLASGERIVPLQPEKADPPPMAREVLDRPEADVERLLNVVARLLGPLLVEVGRRGKAVAGLELGFRFERLGDHIESLRPAAPSLDARLLLELARLRLGALQRLPDAVGEVVLVAREADPHRGQPALVGSDRRRDLAAAERALARVRARLGEDAVVRARLREGHLPEASFAWEPVERLGAPVLRGLPSARLVRRIYARPLPLPQRPRQEPDGWMLRGLEQGPVDRVEGPYVISGGWWVRPVHREYHFAETRKGELLWVYYDRLRRQWFLQGRVE